jgi:hypothetical protein
MANSFLNRCVWTATSGGSGTFTVSAAVTGHETPTGCSNPSVVSGGTYHYMAQNSSKTEWEIGSGVWTTGSSTLTRATIYDSSNAGAAVNFTLAPTVYMGCPLGNDMTTAVATRTELKALNTNDVKTVTLTENPREGHFVWKTGNYSSLVTADTAEAIYIPADGVASSSGAWVRIHFAGMHDVKWFGATGDGTTNDTAAVQAAIDFTSSIAGGTVFFSEGGYLCPDGLTIDTPLVRLEGAGTRYCSISTNNVDGSMITISAARCAVTNLSLFSQVIPNSTGGIIELTSGCVQTTLSDLDMVGGFYSIKIGEGVANILIENIVARQALGGAIIYIRGGAIIIDHCALDQDWPVAVPNNNGTNDKGARANSTAYSVNDFVTLSGKLLQCKTAGTSAGSAPTLLYFGNDITDGSVVWQLAGNADGAVLYTDTSASYVTARDTDMTGSYIYGVRQENGLGGTAPTMTRITDCTIGGTVDYGIKISAGGRVYIDGNELQYPVGGGTGVVGIDVGPGFVGDLYVKGNSLVAGWDTGINLNYSTSFGSALVCDNQVFAATVVGINVAAGVKDFQILNNNLGTSSEWGTSTAGILVNTGGSDWYHIAMNRIHGVSLTDNGTGTHKTVTGNQ